MFPLALLLLHPRSPVFVFIVGLEIAAVLIFIFWLLVVFNFRVGFLFSLYFWFVKVLVVRGYCGQL